MLWENGHRGPAVLVHDLGASAVFVDEIGDLVMKTTDGFVVLANGNEQGRQVGLQMGTPAYRPDALAFKANAWKVVSK